MAGCPAVHKMVSTIALLTEVYRLDLADRALHDELLDLAGAGSVAVIEGHTATTHDTCQQ